MSLCTGAILAFALACASPTSGEIEAPGPQGALRGTLTSPANPAAPTILIIPGSGPTDRDGNNALGVTAASYRLLAEELAKGGVRTVRIDKRGMFGSKDAIADANAVTIPDYVGDVGAWTQAIRSTTGARCVWLLGHSEGGLVALAARNQESVCGLILVSSPGRGMGEVLREQLQANPANAPLLPDALAAIQRLKAGDRVDVSNMHPALQGLFAPQVQGFLVSLLSYDPAEMIASTDKPVLIVQGTRDLQVTEQDALRLAAANSSARLVFVEGMTHTLKQVATDDPAANMATYANPLLPVSPKLIEAIVNFVGAR
jgi:uncharacterized protein